MSAEVEVAARGRRIAFTFDDVLAYHGGGSPGGAGIAFKLLERALPLLDPRRPVRAARDRRRDGVRRARRARLRRARNARRRRRPLPHRPGARAPRARARARAVRLPAELPRPQQLVSRGIEGFSYETVAVGPTRYRAGIAGAGPAVLLLHGFPQTHYCWHLVAPRLTGGNTVVVCDLKGYADSPSEPGGPLGEGYGKRAMAAELVELMRRLGFERFSVAGHDRGGRVAYRMALDHPDAVERLAVLNIVPTVDQFERMAAAAALEYWPWFFLAQSPPFAERVVGASAEHVVRHILETWTARPGAIAPGAVERYVRAFTPAAIAAICAEFRAAFHLDRPLDAEDRAAGRMIGCPVLGHWGAEEGAMSDGPLAVWRRWANDASGGPLRSGHFLPEEAPEELAASLRGFLG